ncbi:hypothetical protein JCM10207_002902 [Rhodosporidiobolus poonsookiae]
MSAPASPAAAAPAPAAPSTAASTPRFISQLAQSPLPAWTTSAVLLGALPLCVRNPRGFPHLLQLPAFAAIFGGCGYMIQSGDALNGSGTTTAWSLIYLFFNAKKALKARQPAPRVLAAVAALQAGTYGWWYFAQ